MSTVDLSWSLREIARILFHYKRRGAIVFAIGMFLVVVALIVCPRKYTSEARLFVRLGRESVNLDPTATVGQVVQLNNSRETEINSVIEVLRSRSNIEKVFDALTPGAKELSPKAREHGVMKLVKDINISSPRLSSVVILTCKSSSPELAQKTLNTLIDVCMQEHLRVNRTPGSYEFFDEQAKLLKKQLDDASTALRDAKNKYGLVTLEGRRVALEQQLGSVKSLWRESDAALAASEARTQKLQSNLSNLPSPLVQQLTGGSPGGEFASMRQKLYELQTKEQELLSKFTAEHPSVVAIRKQVQEATRILQSEAPNHNESVAALVTNEQANAASIRARLESLTEQQTQLEKELQQLNEQELLVTQLERKVRLLDSNYVHYVTGLEQARIDRALKAEGISNLNVVQAPTFVPKPSQPQKLMTLVFGFAASFVAAVGTVLLSNQLDQTLKTVDDVERRLELSVFASIPHVTNIAAPATDPYSGVRREESVPNCPALTATA